MKNRLPIILGVAIVVAIGVYLVLSEQRETPDIPSRSSIIQEGPITERGIITCIPKIGTGPQTMECALGFKNTDGVYYGLRYLSDHDENFTLLSHEITLEITGNLIDEEMFGPDGNRYDTVGTIEIGSISEVKN